MVLPLIADSAMPTEIDYQQRIAAYDRTPLLNLWAQIQAGASGSACSRMKGSAWL